MITARTNESVTRRSFSFRISRNTSQPATPPNPSMNTYPSDQTASQAVWYRYEAACPNSKMTFSPTRTPVLNPATIRSGSIFGMSSVKMKNTRQTNGNDSNAINGIIIRMLPLFGALHGKSHVVRSNDCIGSCGDPQYSPRYLSGFPLQRRRRVSTRRSSP